MTELRLITRAAMPVVALALMLVTALCLGTPMVSPAAIPAALSGPGDDFTAFVLTEFRLPRALTGVAVGFALGIGGALFQIVTRNPLGSPDILGFTTGSAAGALVASILIGGGTVAVGLSALAGGLVVAVFLVAIAVSARLSMMQLVLCGLATSILLGAFNSGLVLIAPPERAYRAARWILGTLEFANWETASSALLAVIVAAPLLLVHRRWARVLGHGDESLASVGVAVARMKLSLLAIGVVFTAIGIAAAGPVALLAFSAPQIARLWAGRGTVPLLPSGLVGATLLLAADTLARTAFAPAQLPVGVVTLVFGGAILVFLVVRSRSASGLR